MEKEKAEDQKNPQMEEISKKEQTEPGLEIKNESSSFRDKKP